MIPQHLRDSLEDRQNFIDKLLTRKQAVNIAEIICFFKYIFHRQHCQILESHWRGAIYTVERFLLEKRRHLVFVDVGETGLRHPRSEFIHIINDLDLYGRRQTEFQRPPTSEQVHQFYRESALEDSRNFLERILLRRETIRIAETILFIEQAIIGRPCHIHCSLWDQAINEIELFLLRKNLHLRRVLIAHVGLGIPNKKFARLMHDCNFGQPCRFK